MTVTSSATLTSTGVLCTMSSSYNLSVEQMRFDLVRELNIHLAVHLSVALSVCLFRSTEHCAKPTTPLYFSHSHFSQWNFMPIVKHLYYAYLHEREKYRESGVTRYPFTRFSAFLSFVLIPYNTIHNRRKLARAIVAFTIDFYCKDSISRRHLILICI